MLGSVTSGFLCSGGENVHGIPGAYTTRNFTYLVRGPLGAQILQCTRQSNRPWLHSKTIATFPGFTWSYDRKAKLLRLGDLCVRLYINIIIPYGPRGILVRPDKVQHQLIYISGVAAHAWSTLLEALTRILSVCAPSDNRRQVVHIASSMPWCQMMVALGWISMQKFPSAQSWSSWLACMPVLNVERTRVPSFSRPVCAKDMVIFCMERCPPTGPIANHMINRCTISLSMRLVEVSVHSNILWWFCSKRGLFNLTWRAPQTPSNP